MKRSRAQIDKDIDKLYEQIGRIASVLAAVVKHVKPSSDSVKSSDGNGRISVSDDCGRPAVLQEGSPDRVAEG